MKTIEIPLRLEVAGYAELNADDMVLCQAAITATDRAYAPYSNFHVGAAIRLADGTIVEGANQENAAFPSGMCAERSACYYAGSRYPEIAFQAIAIAARGTDGELTPQPTAPCGACRQALLEYETLAGAPVRVMLCSADNVVIAPSVASLLPLAFASFD
ncbi:MAG: cytidine deaminase [Bacteroidales bacterium]|nr:cytidine deaminase [Bacteroidales bacterium]